MSQMNQEAIDDGDRGDIDDIATERAGGYSVLTGSLEAR